MKTLFLLSALSFMLCNYSSGQIVCIFCYDQNDSISSGVNNLIVNGSFENTDCAPWPNSDRYCPNSYAYSCDIANWTCTGGGPNTYACTFDDTYVVIPDGQLAAYFGNSFCRTCSPYVGDTSCLVNLGCSTTGLPPGYPVNDPAYGGTAGVSLQQTVNGLTPGDGYVLEFWAGGEWSYTCQGIFALDVGFGDTLLRCIATGVGQIGKRYIVEFIADSTSHTIKFTNWGHITYSCTELVLDNVRLYTIAELSPTVTACIAPSASTFFGASDTDICEKFCINFFDSTQNNPTSWLWHFPGGAPSSSTDQNPINICYDVPGIYDVTLVTTNANGTDSITFSDYITVFETPPFPTITQVGYTLTSSLATSYQWQLNAVDIPGATNQSYTVLQSGYYTVVVSNETGCVNSFTVYVVISGINDVMDDNAISIYPNPVIDGLTVEFSFAKASENGLLNDFAGDNVSLSILNAVGQRIFSSEELQVPGTSSNWKKEIDLHDVASGIYFLEIKSQNCFIKKKIVIEK